MLNNQEEEMVGRLKFKLESMIGVEQLGEEAIRLNFRDGQNENMAVCY
jgi:hypothetical protein